MGDAPSARRVVMLKYPNDICPPLLCFGKVYLFSKENITKYFYSVSQCATFFSRQSIYNYLRGENMKTVYCDIVFAANFFSDFALLYLCARFLQLKPSKFKIFISSVLGGIFAVFCAIFINRVFTRFALTLIFAPLYRF